MALFYKSCIDFHQSIIQSLNYILCYSFDFFAWYKSQTHSDQGIFVWKSSKNLCENDTTFTVLLSCDSMTKENVGFYSIIITVSTSYLASEFTHKENIVLAGEELSCPSLFSLGFYSLLFLLLVAIIIFIIGFSLFCFVLFFLHLSF